MPKGKTSPEERFWSKVVKLPCGCWVWAGSINSDGYGEFKLRGKVVRTHRYSYELSNGTVPSGLELDHICRIPSCVNPAHLRAVSHKENVLAGIGPTALNAVKQYCIHGHPFDEYNTGINITTGGRYCKTCNRKSNIEHPPSKEYRKLYMRKYRLLRKGK